MLRCENTTDTCIKNTWIYYVRRKPSNPIYHLYCAHKKANSPAICWRTVDTFHSIVALDSFPKLPIAFWICLNMNTAAFSSEERKFTWMHIRWMCECVVGKVAFDREFLSPIWNNFAYTTWLCSYDACRLEQRNRAKSFIYVYMME